MLELRKDEEVGTLTELIRRQGYYQGIRLGMTEVCCQFFRQARIRKEADIISGILDPDIIDEMSRFYNRYGNLSDKKMAEHLIKESEYLIGIWD